MPLPARPARAEHAPRDADPPRDARARLSASRARVSSSPRASTAAQSGPDLAQALLNVLRNVSHQDTADYVLALIVEMLAEDKARAAHFHRAPGANEGDAYADLFRVLAKPHWFAQEKALFCLAPPRGGPPRQGPGPQRGRRCVRRGRRPSATAAPMGVAAQTIVQLVQWCCAQLRSPATRNAPCRGGVGARRAARRPRRAPAGHALRRRRAPRAAAVRELRAQLDAPAPAALARRRTEERGSRADPRVRRPDRGATCRLLYEVLCAWFLTFHAPALARDAARRVRGGARGRRAKLATKEKVARVAVLALRNIAERAPPPTGSATTATRALAPRLRCRRRGRPRGRASRRNVVSFCGAWTSGARQARRQPCARGFADEELGAARSPISSAAPRARARRELVGDRTGPSQRAAL